MRVSALPTGPDLPTAGNPMCGFGGQYIAVRDRWRRDCPFGKGAIIGAVRRHSQTVGAGSLEPESPVIRSFRSQSRNAAQRSRGSPPSYPERRPWPTVEGLETNRSSSSRRVRFDVILGRGKGLASPRCGSVMLSAATFSPRPPISCRAKARRSAC